MKVTSYDKTTFHIHVADFKIVPCVSGMTIEDQVKRLGYDTNKYDFRTARREPIGLSVRPRERFEKEVPVLIFVFE